MLPQRKLNRIYGADYSSEGYYFVTTCTKYRAKVFGRVNNNEMVLNKFGKIVEKCWLDLPNHYSNCKLDRFVVMPNHLHGIIIIENFLVLKDENAKLYSLSEIMRGFKTFSSKRINSINPQINFQWQRSFYDRVIRSSQEYENIRNYIANNPYNWEKDRNNIENLLM